MGLPLVIRTATFQDGIPIAHLHSLSWQTTYKDILPPGYLKDTVKNEREHYWTNKMNNLQNRDFVLIAEHESKLVGFAAVWDHNEGDYQAFLDNLHIQPEQKGRGIGSSLLLAIAKRLMSQHQQRFYLWVFDQNLAAIKFYEKWGAEAADHKEIDLYGNRIPETRYIFDVSNLTAAQYSPVQKRKKQQ